MDSNKTVKQDSVALVVGASSGMGRVTALRLAQDGFHVVVAARRMALCETVVSTIQSLGGRATAIAVDVTQDDSVAQCFSQIERDLGRLDAAFNNTGRTLGFSVTTDTPLTRLQDTLDINLIGTFRCLQHELRLMRAGGGGAIVNNASIAATRGFAGLQDYCAAKSALIGLSKAAALEYAQYGIRINVITPGLIATERYESIRAQPDSPIEARLKDIPVGHAGAMEDIAATVSWLLRSDLSFVTGAVIPIDGGECAK
jgi:NAD(P)-dependent dehydrogenase (short-subunit alcohol dehydrogenase family)